MPLCHHVDTTRMETPPLCTLCCIIASGDKLDGLAMPLAKMCHGSKKVAGRGKVDVPALLTALQHAPVPHVGPSRRL